ncbi:hypothetical protein C900_05576 [Fulvivirga imtechensis AK7]|uniref:Dual-action HEIGH metallo-peptidase n=1 Tax=Fulvivirga imtechensis AK7 TaxID=1237149 RepID=L8JL97_9BACT|nr:M57 family metalloprotease [Fulvivirga imtechensis]ELR69018.1 hypothetical protein C900_05576 [Fulvivirga imtechensis AK7]
MKNLFSKTWSVYAVAFCVVLFSCNEQEEVISPEVEKPSDELIDFLVKTGFEKDKIKFEDGVFVIDDDVLISKEELQKYVDGNRSEISDAQTEHYRGYYLVSNSYVTNIKFYIDSSVPSSWVTAIHGAVNQWNAVNGTKLYMSVVSNRSNANTVIGTSYSSQNWVARAYLPSYNGRPGHTMTINTKYNYLNSGYKLFTIVHEMGHIFGLYHTDQTQGYFISGTPATDPNSVMNSYILPWNGFTAGDVAAVQILYPL